ncbi:MAG: bifunctional demethylmenaquinone methyltransferase/2-methoxy-6-polyprenyl-1,4-benzoquinol methylase UbiE [Rickettsiaceae bacterium]|nr:bifunctional demethylmenaquinone methyltransferase/2-methoxy-6-polyprenyl-1,4-benzoquinol methylase UbiE [Rickettsiaceae bacterium]
MREDKDFGFKKVTSGQKRTLVDNVFGSVAGKYNLMNDIMSFGIHRLWKKEFCDMILNYNADIIDVAGGTGDIAFKIKKNAKQLGQQPRITVTDINPEMLKICQQEAINRNILNNFDIVVADAENLPFPDKSFDYYTIAFGIRNVINIKNVLKEAYRVLKPNGQFLCLEFSKVTNQLAAPLYQFYSFNILPKIGKYVTDNEAAYQYLVESIELFPNQEEFKVMIEQQNFQAVGYKNLTFGVAAIHYGTKII